MFKLRKLALLAPVLVALSAAMMITGCCKKNTCCPKEMKPVKSCVRECNHFVKCCPTTAPKRINCTECQRNGCICKCTTGQKTKCKECIRYGCVCKSEQNEHEDKMPEHRSFDFKK